MGWGDRNLDSQLYAACSALDLEASPPIRGSVGVGDIGPNRLVGPIALFDLI